MNNKINISQESKNKIINLYNKLEMNTINFDLLVIYHIISNDLSTKIEKLNENIKIIQIYTKSSSNGISIKIK